MPIILGTGEAEMIVVQGQPGQKVHETPSEPINKLGVVVHHQPRCVGSIERRVRTHAASE
jgi:hypothetical protein